MLGVKNNHTVIKGEYAEKLRDAIRRRDTGELNEEDLKVKERSEKIKKEYRVIWKDKL